MTTLTTRCIPPALFVTGLTGMVSLCCLGQAPHGADGALTATPNRTSVGIYERLDLTLNLDTGHANPFDSRQIAVDAHVTGPEGAQWAVPGFLYQSYRRSLVEDEGAGTESLAVEGDAVWQVRLAFPAPGTWRVVVSARGPGGTRRSAPVTIRVTPRDTPGMVRRHPADHRYFADETGRTVFLSGANVCWGGSRGTHSYDAWLPAYAEAKCNLFRVWLSPMWTTFALNTKASGYEGIDLGNAWRLDYVVQQAERLDLRVMLCIDSFNILRSTKGTYGVFEESPYHVDNGGPVSTPLEYFTSDEMRRAYRDRLRYLVARWGYSTSVFAWEFWNEVDIIDGHRDTPVVTWHRDMARYLRQLDPWQHLITTSTAGHRGKPKLDALEELEFVQTHHYQARDMARDLYRDLRTKQAAADRPHFHGEFGISHSGKATMEMDPAGVHLHNALFASAVQGNAGTAMTWWWDSYVHPGTRYPVFAAFNRWTEGFDFAAAKVRPTEMTFVGTPTGTAAIGPVDFELTNGSWQRAPFNRPVDIAVAADGRMTQNTRPSTVLHGAKGGNSRFHNPVTFKLTLTENTTFEVGVAGVSGWGGARLLVSLNGKRVLDRTFADPDGTETTTTLETYNGRYSIDVPAGTHTIKVDNAGPDWIMINAYHVARMVQPRLESSPVRGYALIGPAEGLLWIQHRGATWPKAQAGTLPQAAVSGERIQLDGLTPGRWRIDWVTTQTGEDAGISATVRVDNDGRLETDLSPVTTDVAARLKHLQ